MANVSQDKVVTINEGDCRRMPSENLEELSGRASRIAKRFEIKNPRWRIFSRTVPGQRFTIGKRRDEEEGCKYRQCENHTDTISPRIVTRSSGEKQMQKGVSLFPAL